jgi:5-methylcytosine-specific restriction protein A
MDRVITIDEAVSIKDENQSLKPDAFICTECGQPVRPHRSGGPASAHFEHLSRNAECSLSHKSLAAADESVTGAGDDWTTQELRAAVEAYVDMQRKSRTGQPFVKKRYYSDLHKQFGRTEKSYEFRMQNISYVLSIMGREWLTGLKPAKNVGARVAVEIETLINDAEGRSAPPVVSLEVRTREELKQKAISKPTGNQSPKSTTSAITQYQRDSTVKAWVLREANGKCECCGGPAPFQGADGMPFLEVHHVQQLADNGPDTVTNAVALCPNCHREIHYGLSAKQLAEKLYATVERLER